MEFCFGRINAFFSIVTTGASQPLDDEQLEEKAGPDLPSYTGASRFLG